VTKVVPVSGYRSRVESASGGIEITIPARRNYFALAIVAVWLCVWVFGANGFFSHPQALNHGRTNEIPPFFLVFWILGVSFAALILLWNLAGRERVVVHSDALSIRREVLGVGWTRSYELRSVKALRVVETIGPMVFGMRQNDPFGFAHGPIAFDYGAKTIRFGTGIEVAEGRYLLSKMVAAKPALAEQT